MKQSYHSELEKLKKWIDNVKSMLSRQIPFIHTEQDAKAIFCHIEVIIANIQDEYPFYALALPDIKCRLFLSDDRGFKRLNFVAFGELVTIIQHLVAEPVAMQFWSVIHIRVKEISYKLYKNGHYSVAAEKAIREVETRLREKFVELKPGIAIPSKAIDIIGALMSENGVFKFCDVTTVSGKNYRRGIQALCEGLIAAYRNPAAHSNLKYTKREAIEQIMLASQLMFVLDKTVTES